LIIEFHNLPFSAKSNENIPDTNTPTIPNSSTGNSDMSMPPMNIGITNDAKNTSEKFAHRVDSARSFDFVILNIKLILSYVWLTCFYFFTLLYYFHALSVGMFIDLWSVGCNDFGSCF